MKKRITIITLILTMAALAAAPLAMAGPGHGGRHGFGPGGHGFGGFGLLGHLRHAQEELDLSDQQVDQLKAIFADMHEQNAQYREQLHGGMKSIADALLANPNDISAAQAIIDQQASAERALKLNLLTATSKALNVLNAEQRTKLSQMLQEHAERRQRRGR